jgi:hypothetical protein
MTFASDCVRQSVHDQLADLTKRTQPYGEQLALLFSDAQIQQRVEEFDRREKQNGRPAVGRGQFNILGWASDPRSPEVGERFLERYVEENGSPSAADICFPLPGADPSHTPLKFPWVRTQEANGGNHQVLVLRLRDALADAMRRRVLQQVSQLNKQVLDGLKDTFTIWSERLLMLSGNAPLLACLVGESLVPAGGSEWKTVAIEYPLSPAPTGTVVSC